MQKLPKITIVTPNFNCADYLEHTMVSVLAQNYPNLEYIVMDDGSTDASVEVIRRYQGRLAYWTTRPNRGHYATVNEGFARATGDIMAWLNSDDMYLPGAFSTVAEIFAQHPEVDWLTTTMPAAWNDQGQAVLVSNLYGYNRDSFLRGGNAPNSKDQGYKVYTRGCIQQESTFWRRSLWERAGGYLDTSLTLAADYELWARFYLYAELYGVRALLGGYRFRTDQNTDRFAKEYREQCRAVLQRYGGKPYGRIQAWLRRWVAWRIYPVLKSVPRATSLGLLFPAKVWVHSGRGGSWTLTTKLVI
jgi:glycosyltransferase involved in cell wall biosynthesis